MIQWCLHGLNNNTHFSATHMFVSVCRFRTFLGISTCRGVSLINGFPVVSSIFSFNGWIPLSDIKSLFSSQIDICKSNLETLIFFPGWLWSGTNNVLLEIGEFTTCELFPIHSCRCSINLVFNFDFFSPFLDWYQPFIFTL